MYIVMYLSQSRYRIFQSPQKDLVGGQFIIHARGDDGSLDQDDSDEADEK